MCWSSVGGRTQLTEVAVPAGHQLPQRRSVDARSCADETECQVELPGGGSYRRRTEVQRLAAPRYWRRHSHVYHTAPPRALFQVFDSEDVDGPGAISRLRVIRGPQRLVIETLHTFPEELTFVRSRSVLQLAIDRETREASIL